MASFSESPLLEELDGDKFLFSSKGADKLMAVHYKLPDWGYSNKGRFFELITKNLSAGIDGFNAKEGLYNRVDSLRVLDVSDFKGVVLNTSFDPGGLDYRLRIKDGKLVVSGSKK